MIGKSARTNRISQVINARAFVTTESLIIRVPFWASALAGAVPVRRGRAWARCVCLPFAECLNGYMCVMRVKRNLWACCPSCYALICLGKGVRTRANTFGPVKLWWHDCC